MWTQAGLPFVDGLGPHDFGVRDVPDTRRCDGVQGPARLLPACLKGAGDCLSRLHTGTSWKTTSQSIMDGNKQVHRIYIVPGLGAAFLSSVAAPILSGPLPSVLLLQAVDLEDYIRLLHGLSEPVRPHRVACVCRSRLYQ